MNEYTTVNIKRDTYKLLRNISTTRNVPIYYIIDEAIKSASEKEDNPKTQFRKRVAKDLESLRPKFKGVKASDLLHLEEYMYD